MHTDRMRQDSRVTFVIQATFGGQRARPFAGVGRRVRGCHKPNVTIGGASCSCWLYAMAHVAGLKARGCFAVNFFLRFLSKPAIEPRPGIDWLDKKYPPRMMIRRSSFVKCIDDVVISVVCRGTIRPGQEIELLNCRATITRL